MTFLRGRWLVSHQGYVRLRRHVQIATMKRSEWAMVPSARTISTGPSMRTGPWGSTLTRRGKPVALSEGLGTDDHQLFVLLVGASEPLFQEPWPA